MKRLATQLYGDIVNELRTPDRVRKRLETVPEVLVLQDRSDGLKGIHVPSVSAKQDFLRDEGIASSMKPTTDYDCGSTGYTRQYQTYEVNLRRLHGLACGEIKSKTAFGIEDFPKPGESLRSREHRR